AADIALDVVRGNWTHAHQVGRSGYHDPVDGHGHEGHADIDVLTALCQAQALLQVNPAVLAETLDLTTSGGIQCNQVITRSNDKDRLLTIVVVVAQTLAGALAGCVIEALAF